MSRKAKKPVTRPTIKPTIVDPSCLDFRRMPDGMLDPVYDETASISHAVRDAASFARCYETCERKACRNAQRCLSEATRIASGSCASPVWGGQVTILADCLRIHMVNMRERHRAWAIALDFGASLVEGDPHEGLD